MLWKPQNPEECLMSDFAKNQLKLECDYNSLHQFSIKSPELFWSAVWDYCDIIGDKGYRVLENPEDMLKASFFPEAKLNFAENLLREDGADIAIFAWGENVDAREISRTELLNKSLAFAFWLKTQGVKAGDRVAAVMPNIPETVMAMLGAASIGAVFSSASPDFGEDGIVDRFGQIEPKILIAVDGYHYNGKTHNCLEKTRNVAAAIPSVKKLVRVRYAGLDDAASDNIENWENIVAQPLDGDFVFERFPFNHPLYILYSSGTTGKPKCIIHGAGGTLLQHVKEHQLQLNLQADDRMFYFTTCGWMMWNWLTTALASRVTIMLYDGAPTYPDASALIDVIASQKAQFLGISAKFIDSLRKQNLDFTQTHDLSNLRTITSTGSPLSPESFDYVYQSIKKDVHLASICGGTDIVSCFVGGSPISSVYRGEIQGAGLGMAVEVRDDNGQAILEERGELVCYKPFPSMPIGFWDDPEGKKYHSAYFDKYSNVWCQGDFAVQTKNLGFLVLGRSDTTLNPGGVRIGTAEIYRQVEFFSEVLDAAVIGQEWQDDVRVVLFVIMKDGAELTDNLRQEIKRKIREGASPRHVPALIEAVPDIPRTKSGKISELTIRDIINGKEVMNTQALANPESLDFFKSLNS